MAKSRRQRRRQGRFEDPSHDRWMMSYADFVTLLFAFFVVMYAISSVNEGKYRVLSDSLIRAFNPDPRTLNPDPNAEPGTNGGNVTAIDPSLLAPVIRPIQMPLQQDSLPQTAWQMEMLEQAAAKIEQGLHGLVARKIVSVDRRENSVAVDINSELLFAIGSSQLLPEAERILQRIGDVLKSRPYYIEVEGFTDNIPIRTEVFPSNWELSAARAASVVHLFTRRGVPPERMVAVGYGQYRPKVSNDSEAGRRANRRVVVNISAPEAGVRK